tara:strand:+ start:346 stop:678 length:333 start_codon:yes stop_codon:yes gene_type:complete
MILVLDKIDTFDGYENFWTYQKKTYHSPTPDIEPEHLSQYEDGACDILNDFVYNSLKEENDFQILNYSLTDSDVEYMIEEVKRNHFEHLDFDMIKSTDEWENTTFIIEVL